MKISVLGPECSDFGEVLNEYSDHKAYLYEADKRPDECSNKFEFTKPHISEFSMVDMFASSLEVQSYFNFLPGIYRE